jgi:hypothetical protein
MASLPQVAFRPAQAVHAGVPVLLQPVVHAGVHFAGDLRAVVAGEDHQRIVGEAVRSGNVCFGNDAITGRLTSAARR